MQIIDENVDIEALTMAYLEHKGGAIAESSTIENLKEKFA